MLKWGYGVSQVTRNHQKHAQSTYLDEYLWYKQNPVQKIHLTAKIEANPSEIVDQNFRGAGGAADLTVSDPGILGAEGGQQGALAKLDVLVTQLNASTGNGRAV